MLFCSSVSVKSTTVVLLQCERRARYRLRPQNLD
jgi:hypothetical protein